VRAGHPTPRPVAYVTLAAVALLAGCGGDHGGDSGGKPPTAAEPTATAPAPARPSTLALDGRAGAAPIVWVRPGERVTVRTAPGGEVVTRAGPQTEFGSPTVFGVVRERDGWAGVATPALPNDQLGWIRLDPDELEAGSTRVSVEVDLSERRAELRDRGRVVRRFAVTVGAPGTETPTGRFAVTDTFRGDLNPAYGCCALALSATQPSLPSGWLGGRRIAIHGTSGPLGIAASHGCVRAADAEVSRLVSRVPLGAPVFIRA
jgi:L,D-transpeptidase catalytic domain